jgi:hypothetical protein
MCILRFMLDCDQTTISWKIFIRFPNIKFHIYSTNGRLVDTFRRTGGRADGRTDITKLIGSFAGFAKTSVSQTSLFFLFPLFHALSANTFKLIPNFLS